MTSGGKPGNAAPSPRHSRRPSPRLRRWGYPSRRHSRHPSCPRRRRDDWGVGNPVALASSTYCRFTSARLAPAPVRIKAGGDAPSRRHSRHPSRPTPKAGTTGVSGIQWLLQVAPTVVSPQRVLPPPAVRIKEGGDCPSRRHSRHPSRPRRRRDDWGVGNPVALASSTYCRFTSARLAPARRQDQRRWGCPLPPSLSPLFKPSILTIYSTLLYEGGRLFFDSDGVRARDTGDLSGLASLDIKANSCRVALNIFSEIRERMAYLFFTFITTPYHDINHA